MDDMQAFERRVADEMQRRAGPSLPVDNLAITDAVTTTTQSPTWRFQSMFSATKFVVAGVIVALFGGFLLTGILTTQPSQESLPAAGASASSTAEAETVPETTTQSELLPGVSLVTEEVESGVIAVLQDGAGHDLRRLQSIEITPDGSVWVSDDSRRLYRLGQNGSLRTGNGQYDPLVASSPDGGLFIVSGQGVHLVDPMTPRRGMASGAAPEILGAPGPDLPKRVSMGTAISAAPDGSVWASWTAGMNNGDTRIVRYDGTEWSDLSGTDELGALIDLTVGRNICDIAHGSAGDTWVGVCGSGGLGFGGGGLFRHGDSGWDAVPVFGDVGRSDLLISDVLALASGTDGTMWALVLTTTQEVADAVAAGDLSLLDEEVDDPLFGPIFIRYRDGRWSAYPWATVSPEHGLVLDPLFDAGDLMVVDDRGVLWFVAGGGEHAAEVLASFDGETVRRYPAVTDIEDLSIDTEGRAWVVGWDGLQVITPEAVAATE